MVDYDIYFYKLCITNTDIHTHYCLLTFIYYIFFKIQADVLITLGEKIMYLCLNVKDDIDSVTGILYPFHFFVCL